MITLPLPKLETIEPWELHASEWSVIACMAVTTVSKFAAYSMGVAPPSLLTGSYELEQSEAEWHGWDYERTETAIHLINRVYSNRYAVLANNARAGKFGNVISIDGAESEYPIEKLIEFVHAVGWELPTQLLALLPAQNADNDSAPSTYSTPWLGVTQAAIVEFFEPRRRQDAKKEEVVEWIKKHAASVGLSDSGRIAEAIFTIIKPSDHNPRKRRNIEQA